MAITTTYSYTMDLDKDGLRETLRSPLFTLNSKAHTFAIEVKQGASAASLAGARCTGYFIRTDGVTVPIDGTVSGNVASVTLLPNCYAVQGCFELSVDLALGDVIHTILHVDGSILRTRTNIMTNGGSAAQSFDELVSAVRGMDAALKCRDRVVNLLDNSDFSSKHFIAQAGLNGKHGTILYLGDRWNSLADISAAQQAAGVRLSTTAQSSFIWQKVSVKAGEKYTFAIRAANRTGAHRIAAYNANNSVIYAQDYAADRDTLIVTFEAGEDVVSMLYYPGYTTSGGSSSLLWATLYEGEYTADTLPAYVYKGYAAELAECRLHYENSWYPGNTHQQNQMQGFVAGSALDTYISFKQRKRILPTIILHPYSPGTYTNWSYFNGTSKDASAMTSVMRCGNNGFMARLTPAAGDTVTRGSSYAVDGHWEACADM